MKKDRLKTGAIEHIKDTEHTAVEKRVAKISKKIKAKDLTDTQVKDLVLLLAKQNNLI